MHEGAAAFYMSIINFQIYLFKTENENGDNKI